MPRFFFHLHDDLDVVDLEGLELADLEQAHSRAIKEARQLICQTITNDGRIAFHHRIDVEDELCRVVATVVFRDAVTVEN